jgi:hypothetical protein
VTNAFVSRISGDLARRFYGDLETQLFETLDGLAGYQGAIPFIKVVAAQILVGLLPAEHIIGDDEDTMPNGDDGSALAPSLA